AFAENGTSGSLKSRSTASQPISVTQSGRGGRASLDSWKPTLPGSARRRSPGRLTGSGIPVRLADLTPRHRTPSCRKIANKQFVTNVAGLLKSHFSCHRKERE